VDLTVPPAQPLGAIEAAGGLLWRRDPRGRIQVALVHRPRYDDWSLPKGKLLPGEHLAAAAVREIEEETGQTAVLGRPLPTDHYLVEEVPKTVHYWAAPARGGSFRPNAEVDALIWASPEVAVQWLTRPGDVDILTAFLAGPLDTRALIVLRHAQAVPRKAWRGDDCERPLHDNGLAQAVALVPVLSAFGPVRVLSSPARRCLDTVRPLAEAAGAAVEVVSGLAEGVSDSQFAAAMQLVTTAADAAPTVVCSHRPILPRLFQALAQEGRGQLPRKPLQPAEFMIFHLAGRFLAAIERHHP
jgi:8-oxo-dGTP diphosphatase